MTEKNFTLLQFPGERPAADIRISGTIRRRQGKLAVRFNLSDNLARVILPGPADRPRRKNRLWQQTCLEFFLAQKDAPAYWEWNLSPAGHWNIYHFSDYRQDMEEAQGFSALPITVAHSPGRLAVAAETDIGPLFPPTTQIEAAISAVLLLEDNTATHWALRHCGAGPDFHQRACFGIEL